MKRTVTSLALVFALLGGQQTFAQRDNAHPSYHYLKENGLLHGYTNEQLVAMQQMDSNTPTGPVVASNPTPPVIQSQAFTAGPDTTVCAGSSVTLTATLLVGTPTYLTLTDDEWSGVINLPFPFTFYGNTYNQCVIGSNDNISFNLANANQYDTWPINAAVPTPFPADQENAILGPWQDLLPPSGGTIGYTTIGIAPNRVFVVDYCNVAMFSCTTQLYSSQIQLFEGNNNIEVHILSKPICATWNGGYAIQATQNMTGTIANVVPGRNYPTQWSATNDGQRFTPNGPNAYTIASIPFNPMPLANSTISWYLNGNLIGTGSSITVTPAVTSNYIAQATSSCGNFVYSDTATVTIGGALGNISVTPATATVCAGGSVQLTASGGTTYSWSPTTGLSNPNIANPVATPSATTTYTVTVGNGSGCTGTATSIVTVGGTGPVVSIATSGGNCNAGVILIGYPGNPVVLTATAPGAVSYLWSTGATTQSISLTSSGIYTVTATDANGCTGVAVDTIPTSSVVNVLCGHNGDKIILCHVPPGNPNNPQTICVAASAIPHHLANHPGDCVGPCSLYYPRYGEVISTINEVGFFAEAYPNPFNNSFALHLIIAPDEAVTVNIHDVTGRIIETYNNVTELTQIGTKLAAGIYAADVIQGENHQMLHLVKVN